MTQRNSSILRRINVRLCLLIVLGLFCARTGSARQETQNSNTDPEVFGSQVNSLLAAQQDALSSGNPEKILKTSSSVAAASLALLNNLDAKDQESRKALEALPYAGRASRPICPRSWRLLEMELGLGETSQAVGLKKHIVSTNPDTAELHLQLAQVFEKGHALVEAVQEAQRAVALEPASPDAQIALGMAYWRLNGFGLQRRNAKAR